MTGRAACRLDSAPKTRSPVHAVNHAGTSAPSPAQTCAGRLGEEPLASPRATQAGLGPAAALPLASHRCHASTGIRNTAEQPRSPAGSTVIGFKVRGPAQHPAVPSVPPPREGPCPGPFPPTTRSSENEAPFCAEKGPPRGCLRVRGHTRLGARRLLRNRESSLMTKLLSFENCQNRE